MKKPLALALFLLAATGCAIKTPPMSVSQFPVGDRAPYYQQPHAYRVAVLPFEDRRPEVERQGQKPKGVFLLLVNSRVGDYYTGNKHFGANAPVQLAEQLAGYLRKANLFVGVDGPSSLSGLPRRKDANEFKQFAQSKKIDYFLTGEIHHFFGSQHQNAYFYAVPAFYVSLTGWRSSKSLPWGRTVIDFALVDANNGDVVWSEQLQADRTLPKDTDAMTSAAMESFLLVSSNLAAKLNQLSLSGQKVTLTRLSEPVSE